MNCRWLASAGQSLLDLVQVFASVAGTDCTERALRVQWVHVTRVKLGDPTIDILCDLDGELCERARLNSLDQGTGRVINPVDVIWLMVGCGEPFAALELAGQDAGTGIPECDMAENPSHRPMLVDLASQMCVGEPFDEAAHPVELAAILSHEVRFDGSVIPDGSTEGHVEWRYA